VSLDKEQQSRVLTSSSVDAVLAPGSVAIVGASEENEWSRMIFQALTRDGYEGEVHLVNPKRDTLWGQACHPSLRDLPSRPDHALVLAPGRALPGLVREAVEARIPAVTLYGSPVGPLPDEVAAVLADGDTLVLGPNCLGLASARRRLNAMPAHQVLTRPGPIAVVGQSGGVVLHVVQALHNRGAAVGHALTTGNEWDAQVADCIAACARAEGIRVVVAFIEAIRDLERFVRACEEARDAGVTVVAIKSGGTAAGREAAFAHTGAMVGSGEAFEALCAPLGVVTVHSLEAAVEAAEFYGVCGRPVRPGAAAVVYSGGLRELLVDAAGREGLSFRPLSQEAQDRLHELLPFGGTVGNPLDIGFLGLTKPEVFFACIDVLLAEGFGAVLAQETPPVDADDHRSIEYLAGLDRRAAEHDAAIGVFSFVKDRVTDFGRQRRVDLPHLAILQGVDGAMAGIRAVARVGGEEQETVVRERRPTPEDDGRRVRVAEILDALPAGTRALDEDQSKKVLAAYGVPVPPEVLAGDVEAAVAAARDMGFPVVLKGVSREVTHKSDVGLVQLDLQDEVAVRGAYAALASAAEAVDVRLAGVLVTAMAPPGPEFLVGLTHDIEVGDVVLVGSGGVGTELLDDIAHALVRDLDHDTVARLVRSTKSGKLADGYRHAPRFDLAAVEDSVWAIVDLVRDFPGRFSEVEVNPLRLGRSGGSAALDALVVLDSGGEP